MRQFQERRVLKKFLFSKITIGFLLAIVFLLFFSTFKVYKKAQEAILKDKESQNKIIELENKKKQLESELSRFKTKIGIESELRKKFQIKKPGEEYVIILQNNNQDKGTKKENNSFINFIQKLKRIFKF